MNELDILKAGRELLSDPNRWTKRTLARDKNGHATDVYDAKATCFCSLGAMHRAALHKGADLDTRYRIQDRLTASVKALYPRHPSLIYVFNDSSSTTHDQILAVWDHAIANYE